MKHFKPFVAAALVSAACSSAPATPSKPTAGPTFVLVHGAWMGAWAWDDVATRLREQGAKVIAVELPGHGDDHTPVQQTTLDAYVRAVEATVDGAPGRVFLVGHSMAGVVVSQVAEHRADALAGVVYLAAYVPKDKQTLQELAGTDAASHVGPVLAIDATTGLAGIPRDKLGDIFCADCDATELATLAKRYRDEPLPAFGAPVSLTAASWGRVAKYYIYTKQDHAVSFDLQQRMTAGVTWTKTATLDTSHAPFLSKPAEVASALARFTVR